MAYIQVHKDFFVYWIFFYFFIFLLWIFSLLYTVDFFIMDDDGHIIRYRRVMVMTVTFTWYCMISMDADGVRDAGRVRAHHAGAGGEGAVQEDLHRAGHLRHLQV